MAEMGMFPDAAILLSVEDADVISRLLPPKLDRWKVKRDKRMAKKAKKKEKAKAKRVCIFHYYTSLFHECISFFMKLSHERRIIMFFQQKYA